MDKLSINKIFWNSVPKVKIVKMDTEEFVSIPPIHCQRDHVRRASRIAKLLKEFALPTHREVAVGIYPERLYPHEPRIVTINGHTRQEIWRRGLAPVPPNVQVSIYPCADKEYARTLYYTFDSQRAVETAKDKIAGAARAFNRPFLHPKIGSKVLEYASLGHPVIKDPLDPYETVPLFTHEIDLLMSISLNSIFEASKATACLMLLKKYSVGPSEKLHKLMTGIRMLRNRENLGNPPALGACPILTIQNEWDTKKFFSFKSTNAIALPRQIDFVLWCFEKWMKEERIKVVHFPPARKDLYNTWWNYLK